MFKLFTFILLGNLAVCSNATANDDLSLQDYLDELNSFLELSAGQDQASYEHTRVLPMVLHIKAFYGDARPESSFRNREQRLIDCFRAEYQPALLGRNGSYRALESPPESRNSLSSKALSNSSRCKSGEVQVPRLSLDMMRQFRNLHEFLLKSPVPDNAHTASLTGGVKHYYATAIKTGKSNKITGTRSNFNVWQPTVSSKRMSLSQLWLSSGSGGSLQTVESGWQVYPNKYSSDRPVVFIFYTPDNYANGCYNLDCKAFVVISKDIPIGQALPSSMISQMEGAQKEIQLEWTLNSMTGSWWLWYEGGGIRDWAGYYPKEVFNGGAITMFADELEFGGEDTGEPNALQMGSGQFASQGFKKAAYQRDVRYRPLGESSFLSPELSDNVVTEPCYTLNIFNSSTPDWNSYLYFGGPKCPFK